MHRQKPAKNPMQKPAKNPFGLKIPWQKSSVDKNLACPVFCPDNFSDKNFSVTKIFYENINTKTSKISKNFLTSINIYKQHKKLQT